MKKKILTATTHQGSACAVSPVIKELERRGFEVISYATGPAENVLRRDDISFRSFSDSQVLNLQAYMDGVINGVSPDFVLTGVSFQEKDFSYTAEQTAILSARKSNIPCLSVTDFWERDWIRRFRNVHTKEEFVYLPDMLTAIDDFSKKGILAQGVPLSEERIFVTGNPSFDQWSVIASNFSEEDRRQVKRDLGFREDSRLVVYANQGIEAEWGSSFGYTERSAVKDFLRGLKSLSHDLNLALLIKQHPRFSLDSLVKDIEEFRQQEGFDIFTVVNKEYDTRKAILASSAIVSHFSSILVEAALAGKPAISLQPELYDQSMDLLRTNRIGLTLPIYQSGEIGGYMKRVFTEEGFLDGFEKTRKKFVDGRATERVVKIVERSLEK